jgi:hypothetical protein
VAGPREYADVEEQAHDQMDSMRTRSIASGSKSGPLGSRREPRGHQLRELLIVGLLRCADAELIDQRLQIPALGERQRDIGEEGRRRR